MTTPDEGSSTSRRDMLKRSALIGGTLLWVTPTVSVLSATPALASANTPGDGSRLAADFYLLSIKCGSTWYLVKICKDPHGVKPFTVQFGRDKVTDPKGSKAPKITRQHVYAHSTAGPPPDVEFYTLGGALTVDLDKDNDGHACTIAFWVVVKGRIVIWKNPVTGQYGPHEIDHKVVQFPIPRRL